MKDRNNINIQVGDKVIWYDPELSARDLTRVYTIDEIKGDTVCISDECSEVEVFASELEKVKCLS